MDLGDTFRGIRKDEPYQREAKETITRLLGVVGDPVEFYKNVIEPRYDKYREWALTFYCEALVKELWTRWLRASRLESPATPRPDTATWARETHKPLHLLSYLTEKSSHGCIDYPLMLVEMAEGVEEICSTLSSTGAAPSRVPLPPCCGNWTSGWKSWAGWWTAWAGASPWTGTATMRRFRRHMSV